MTSSAGSDLYLSVRSPRVRPSPPRPASRSRRRNMQRPVWWLRLVAALPLRVLYALATLIAWVTFRLVPYRAEVVRENLQIAFPDADATQLRDIMRRYYSGFAQVLVEIVKAVSWPAARLREHVQIANLELIREPLAKGNSVL